MMLTRISYIIIGKVCNKIKKNLKFVKGIYVMDNELNEQTNFIMYTTDDGQVDIEVRLEEENVWLTQKSMAELFETTRNNITMHIKNIFEDGELQEKTVSKEDPY